MGRVRGVVGVFGGAMGVWGDGGALSGVGVWGGSGLAGGFRVGVAGSGEMGLGWRMGVPGQIVCGSTARGVVGVVAFGVRFLGEGTGVRGLAGVTCRTLEHGLAQL